MRQPFLIESDDLIFCLKLLENRGFFLE